MSCVRSIRASAADTMPKIYYNSLHFSACCGMFLYTITTGIAFAEKGELKCQRKRRAERKPR